jgi:DNA-binding HxlR family transcriptional regulator
MFAIASAMLLVNSQRLRRSLTGAEQDPKGNSSPKGNQCIPKAEPKCCPLETLLKNISGRWPVSILWIPETHGALRFGELRRRVHGISTKVLTERLRLVESIQLVHRQHQPTIPPQVIYTLTERGKELSGSLDHLYALAVLWDDDGDEGVADNTMASL